MKACPELHPENSGETIFLHSTFHWPDLSQGQWTRNSIAVIKPNIACWPGRLQMSWQLLATRHSPCSCPHCNPQRTDTNFPANAAGSSQSKIQYNFLAAHQPSHIIPGEWTHQSGHMGVGRNTPCFNLILFIFYTNFQSPCIRLFSVKITIERTWILYRVSSIMGEGYAFCIYRIFNFFLCFEVFSQMGRVGRGRTEEQGKPYRAQKYKHEQFVPFKISRELTCKTNLYPGRGQSVSVIMIKWGVNFGLTLCILKSDSS